MFPRLQVEIGRYVTVVLCTLCSVSALNTEYLTDRCNGSASISTSGRLESSTSLTYSSLVTCSYHVTVPAGNRIQIMFRRFEVEGKLTGSCVDYLDVHDGTDLTAIKLNQDKLCGEDIPGPYTSTGTDVTILFKTDDSAVYRGFGIIFTAVTNAPCGTGQFDCGDSLCIASELKCDSYDQCANKMDEAQCPVSNNEEDSTNDSTALILGLSIGLSALVVVVIAIAVYIYQKYQYKRFLREPLPELDGWEGEDTYPVTRKYHKSEKSGYSTMENKHTQMVQPRQPPEGRDSSANVDL